MAAEALDVVVVGGGLAGVAAACAAADRGAATLLVEQTPALGGNAGGAFVHTICGLYEGDAEAPVPLNPGFTTRFVAGLAAAGGAGEPERAGRVWVVPTQPPTIEGYAAELCAARPLLDVRLGCGVVAARLGERGAALVLEETGGRRELFAGLVIDATGDGSLGTLARADTETAPPDRRQLPSFIVRIAGVPDEDVAGYGRLRLTVALASAARRAALPAGCESVLLRPAAPGEAYLTLNISRAEVAAASATEPGASRRAIEARAREHVEAIVVHLRETRAGYEACRVVAWPRRLGVREGGRLLGQACIDETALLAGLRRDDEVALSSWPIELWHDHRGARFRYPEAACSIPLGALVSRSHPRLGMAGRCLSASHEALGALRVLGTALATGEAIGIAAALAAERRCGLAEVKAEEVRRAQAASV